MAKLSVPIIVDWESIKDYLNKHDIVEVIRCKGCKHSIDYYGDGECYCRRPGRALDYKGQKWDGYCDAGERREE